MGYKLLEAAIFAKASTSLASTRWLALAGGNAKPDEFERLQQLGGMNGVAVERSVPDLAATVAGAQLSISQAGYNTVADILVAGCRAVSSICPDGETEQSRRAACLLSTDGSRRPEQELTPMRSKAIDRALSLPSQCKNSILMAPRIPLSLYSIDTDNRKHLC